MVVGTPHASGFHVRGGGGRRLLDGDTLFPSRHPYYVQVLIGLELHFVVAGFVEIRLWANIYFYIKNNFCKRNKVLKKKLETRFVGS